MYPEVSDPQVLVIAPQEGIYLAMKSIVQLLIEKHGPDDIHAVVTFPAYQSLYGVLNMHTEVSYWKAEYKEDSGWQFDLKQLAKLIQPKTRFLVVNFPHNPTAFVPSLSQWQEIIDLCREKQLILFCDEMYRLSDNDGSDPLPSAVSMYENAVTLSGLSKTFGLPGLRIGWLCTRDAALMEKMAEYKDYLTICSSAPSEILSIMALRNKQKLIDRTVRVIRGNLDVLSDFFHEYEEYFEWHRPSACTTMFARLKPKALALGGGSAAGLCERLVNEAELLLVPGSIFEFEDKFVRIGFGRRNMPEAVEVLRSFMKQQTR
ncbi:uncharacterized protein LOC106179298 [Lingula anatina]|uniref:Uncharacterized protein LOC106179298 n=1 Tax=Lingula anatina TaxID=7574 RepID=A0A1S3K7S1_LINAN|nr:uncharacterized protein LOC106179298 [Lingula anatina]|eukprot:XP_013418306.1 uncharacterized protein LOC106179298 [Lingula anatina]